MLVSSANGKLRSAGELCPPNFLTRDPARDHDLRFTIEECPFPSTYRLFTLASWPRCGARSRRARLARRGVRPWTRSGSSFAASRGPRTDGHNIFLYHHPTQPDAPILCDFGVEVTHTFETAGEVYETETPAGEAAVAVHRGPYNRMNEAHDAIRKWMAANRRESRQF